MQIGTDARIAKEKFMKKFISLLLTALLVMTSGVSTAFASEDVSKEPPAAAAQPHPEVMRSGLETVEAEEEIAPDEIVTAIIELEEEPLITKAEGLKDSGIFSERNKSALLSRQKSVQNKISSKVLSGESMQIVRSYTVAVNGFAARVPYGKLEEIRKISGVAAAYAAPTFKVAPDMTSSLSVLGGMENTSGYNGEGTVIAIIDSGLEVTHEVFKAAPAAPALTQDDITSVLQKNELQAEESVKGLTAAQVYHNAKIPFAFDYADNDTNVTPGSAGDHGTHVAGIAAANAGVQSDVSGVASQAQLLAMKVFGSGSSNGATWDDILAAIDDAVCLGADVINMSLGSTAGFASTDADEGVGAVYQRVTDAGIMLSVAGGNEYSAAFGSKMGKSHALTQNPDYGTVASPGSYNASVAVASMDKADVIQSLYLTAGERKIAFNDTAEDSTVDGVDENSKHFKSLSGSAMEYVVVPGYGESADYESLDVSGKIALVSRGSTDYDSKKKAAKAAGAAGLLVYNNEPGMMYMKFEAYDLPAAFISQADGQWLADKNGSVKLNISNVSGEVESPTSGQMSDFSSWGVTPELTLKPDITAPGGNIKSATTGNSYTTKSGTSMAAPYVGGAMAVIKQYIEQKHADEASSETEKAALTSALMMSTADIVYEENGLPYSPRKQGAGSVNVDRAVRSSAYATVPGSSLPKIELGDDVSKTGVYTMSVDVHNYSDKAVTYRVGGTVQTDGAEVTKQYKGKDVWQTTERPYKLSAAVSSAAGGTVTVAAGRTVNVPVTVTLTAADKAYLDEHFANGMYVEGFITLTPEGNNDVTLSVPYMGFYGDWTRASVIDRGYYWDDLNDDENWSTQYTNTAGVSSLEGQVTNYLGDNPYHEDVPYLADRNAISPNDDDTMDALDLLYTGLLRNVKSLKYSVTGEDGTVYYEKTVDYEIKSVYDSSRYRIVPAGVEDYSKIDPWYGTDADGKTLANGTKATVRIECELPYDKHAVNNEKLSWEFPITVDTEEPSASDITAREENGAYFVSLKVSDNEYVSNVCFANASGDKQLGSYPVAETEKGRTSEVEYNVTGYGEQLTIVVNDYAGNRKEYKVTVEGNTDDSEVIVPTKSIFKEDFEEDTFPANGWTLKSQSATTWQQKSEYTKVAHCDYAKEDQNEWLISPEIDLSAQKTRASIIFDFWTNYYWSVQSHHHNLKVKATMDGGDTWTDIWQLWNVTKEFEAWTKTQAKVSIPDEFQDAEKVSFAFVYEGNDGTEVNIDNINIYVEDPQATHIITATAGEGGIITPSGRVSISDGKSKEFKITPDEGYAVRDVTVDGTSVGAVESYKFTNVTEDHTIEAVFDKAGAPGTAETLIDEDFESLTSGGALPEGWTLKSTNSSYSWKIYKYFSRLGLYCSSDNYDPDSGWGWRSTDAAEKSDTELLNGDKQDERIILPAADLSGGKSELSYQFTGNISLLKNGKMTCTVEASTDGGATWTELWNAVDTIDSMQTGVVSNYVGTADLKLEIPEESRSASTLISFRYQRPALSEDGGPVFVDNVKLTATKAAAAARKTVLEEDFEGQAMPDGWTVGKTNSSYSWRVYKAWNHWMAQCQADTYDPDTGWGWRSTDDAAKSDVELLNGDKQDERLITPALDLTGGNAELSYQFSVVPNMIRNSRITFTIEASADGGSTWTELWNASEGVEDLKTGTISSALGTGDFTVKLPQELQTASTQIAFRYQSKAYNQNNGPVYLDNIKVETDNGGSASEPEKDSFIITASAGQGGTISPDGAQSVKKGADITFAIAASDGYETADVLVDGASVGAAENYTFENVTQSHTIAASFVKKQTELADSIHEDFNSSSMPDGWSVEGPSKNYNYETWRLGKYEELNSSMAAICSQNIMFKQSQDEKLTLPQIKMSDSMKLTFDYGGSYEELVSGSVKLTVKATLNKGASWTAIWNAADSIEAVDDGLDTPENITGKAELMIPAAYCSENARFAFVFESNDRRNATVAVDNVVLEKSSAAPSNMYAVNIAATEHGTVEADRTLAAQGTVIKLTVTPDEGYELREGSLRANGEPVSGNQFVMPAENVNVTAAFDKKSGGETEPGSYRDGVYTGSARGYDPDVKIKVQVTVVNGRISAVEVLEQQETESYWRKAVAIVEKLIGLGDDESISNVQAVSGATVSSDAVRAAVLNALKDAKKTDSGIFASGSGTAKDPYIIKTIDQMEELAKSVNKGEGYSGKYIALGANISAEGIEWIPVGTANHGKYTSFDGSFDGRGYTISDITCGTSADPQSLEVMGVFGALGEGAEVKNLNVVIEKFYNDISADGLDAAVGGIAGVLGKNAVIDHCTVSGGANALSSVASNADSCSIGGIAGRMEAGSLIANSWSDIGISDGSLEMDADMKHYAGGICGRQAVRSIIANCASFGLNAVSAGDGDIHVGGLAGETSGAIYNSYSMGSTRGNNIVNSSTNPTTAVGMLIGNTTNEKALYNCYYYVNANQVIDFTDQAGDEDEGKSERRKVAGYDSAARVDADLTYVNGMSAAKLASEEFADTMNDGRKKAAKAAADEYLSVSVSDREDVLDDGYMSWSLKGDRVIIEGTELREQTVSGVELLREISVPYGTEESALALPQTVAVKLSDGGSASLSVTWSCSAYDAHRAGSYTFEGTLKTISGISNPDGLKAYQVVVVEPSGETEEKYTVTVSGGKLTVNGAEAASGSSLAAGTAVTVTADTPAAGKEFSGWTASGVTLEKPAEASVTFTMPANAVVLTANWKDKSSSGGGSGGGSGGSGGGSSSTSNITVTKPENGTVTVSPSSPSAGQTVTVTVKPDTDYVTDKVNVTDSDGNNIAATKIADNRYVFIMPDGKVSVKADFKKSDTSAKRKMPFGDVKEGSYYYDPVMWAADNDITQGATAALFMPELDCTRGQVVTFLWRSAGSPEPGNKKLTFKDVDDSAYYYDAVRWATENGITQGTSESTFSPDDKVTRAQFVTFLWRAENTPDAAGENPFRDLKSSAYYYDAVLWAAENGITSGTSADNFSPDRSCTRGQVVTFLKRIADRADR